MQSLVFAMSLRDEARIPNKDGRVNMRWEGRGGGSVRLPSFNIARGHSQSCHCGLRRERFPWRFPFVNAFPCTLYCYCVLFGMDALSTRHTFL